MNLIINLELLSHGLLLNGFTIKNFAPCMDSSLNLFPGILTDNGSEHSNPKVIEEPDMLSGLKTRVFYCDAGKPYQKGVIEVNHELI